MKFERNEPIFGFGYENISKTELSTEFSTRDTFMWQLVHGRDWESAVREERRQSLF